jgi:hypothetical protein
VPTGNATHRTQRAQKEYWFLDGFSGAVTPAEAGAQGARMNCALHAQPWKPWFPAFAGMTEHDRAS